MKLIVGLGNPGPDYANTRHNLGAKTVKAIAKRYKVKLRLNRSLKSRVAKANILDNECILAIPDTFMNLSGEAVELLLRKENISLPDLMIIYDDMDLELGSMRFRKKGSSGGHKGLSSVIQRLNTDEFSRLKLGINKRPLHLEASSYVLSNFLKRETKILIPLFKKVIEAVEVWTRFGIDKAMNEFNRVRT